MSRDQLASRRLVNFRPYVGMGDAEKKKAQETTTLRAVSIAELLSSNCVRALSDLHWLDADVKLRVGERPLLPPINWRVLHKRRGL